MASAAAAAASSCCLGFRVDWRRARWCCNGATPSSSRLSYSYSFTTFARRRRKHNAPITPLSPPPNPKVPLQLHGEVDDDKVDEDAFEALFNLLEEDLKNDGLSINDSDDEISEEDLAKLEKELEEALGDEDFHEISGLQQSDLDNLDSDDEQEEDRRPQLKNWQLRRLAAALKIGRRKANIKSLSAELGLDRAFVLELLRDPPPNLLSLSASLPDKIVQQERPVESPLMPATEATRIEPEVEDPLAAMTTEHESEVKVPIHVMQTRWSGHKRLKKVQVETLEKVYYRTKRPTNAMISSIVHVTNLPGKTVVKWFEDRRVQDGIAEQRQPFHRHKSKKL